MKRLFSARNLVLAGLSLFSLFAFAACGEVTEMPTEQTNNQSEVTTETGSIPQDIVTYKIGVIAPMSGDAGVYGIESKRVLDYVLNEINNKAAATGYKIELVYEDGKCTGTDAATAFQKLTDIDGAQFVIGGVCSSESLSIIPLLADKKAVALSWGSSSPELEGKSPNFFTLSYNDALVAEGIANELGKFKKVALISEQNDFNQAIKNVVEKTLAEKYPESAIVANEEFPKGGNDFRNQLEKLKVSGAEAVVLNANVGTTAEALLKQAAEIKDWKVQFMSQSAYLPSDILAAAPERAEGMIIMDAPSVNNPDFKDYQEKIISANGRLDNLGMYYTASAADALNIFSQIIAENDGDSAKVREALASGTFEGWLGDHLTFGGKTFVQGIGVAKYVVKNGKAELVPTALNQNITITTTLDGQTFQRSPIMISGQAPANASIQAYLNLSEIEMACPGKNIFSSGGAAQADGKGNFSLELASSALQKGENMVIFAAHDHDMPVDKNGCYSNTTKVYSFDYSGEIKGQ